MKAQPNTINMDDLRVSDLREEKATQPAPKPMTAEQKE